MSDGHPIILLLWDAAREAYLGAEEVTLSVGKFSELSQETQDKFRDYFWYSFAESVERTLSGRAWLFEGEPERAEHDWRTGTIPTKVGDVLLEATGL